MYSLLVTLVSYIIKPGKRRLISFSYKLKSKIGLEIGGPSSLFSLKGYFPVYLFAKRIDGVNFSNKTVWEGEISEGETYAYLKNKKGYQYIQEASELKNFSPESYDFLLSCHSLEHIANPIKALKSWVRLLKKGGWLILVLPNKENTFDIKRPYTTFSHLVDDFNNNVDEHDTTHFEEIISNYVHEGGEVDSQEAITKRLDDNFRNRCAHHHVFNFETIRQLLAYCGLSTVYQQKGTPFHLITIAKKD
jgi:predicted SAM-dependent methyltransferase